MSLSLEVQLAHSVEEVGQQAWDHLARGRPFTSYRWYRFGERAMAYAKPLYVVLSRHGEPVARATFWVTPREAIPIQYKWIRFALEAMLRRWPLLICQAPLTSAASTTGLILPDPPLRDEALRTIAVVADELSRQHGASFCVFGYLEQDEARRMAWPDTFSSTVMWGSGTRMAISWGTFQEYLAHLNKKRRYNVRRNKRLAADLGLEVARYPTVADVDQAMALHENVNRRHKGCTEPWMRGAMENAGMVDSVWLAVEQDGRLVGSELMLGDQAAWLVTGLGLDYSVQYAYFLLGYADIECAIDYRAKVLRWGSLAYEVKERLGFELESNDWVVFAGRGAMLQKVGRWVAAMEEGRAGVMHET